MKWGVVAEGYLLLTGDEERKGADEEGYLPGRPKIGKEWTKRTYWGVKKEEIKRGMMRTAVIISSRHSPYTSPLMGVRQYRDLYVNRIVVLRTTISRDITCIERGGGCELG